MHSGAYSMGSHGASFSMHRQNQAMVGIRSLGLSYRFHGIVNASSSGVAASDVYPPESCDQWDFSSRRLVSLSIV